NVDKVIPKEDSNTIFKECDFVVCLLPLTSTTVNFINEDRISLMKNNSYLINISRGEIIETQALKKALSSDKIEGAVLDVFDKEPLTGDNDEYNIKNKIITTHSAGDRFPKYKYRAFEKLINKKLVLKEKKGDFINEIDMDRKY